MFYIKKSREKMAPGEQTPVLIAGGGPVGMTLALELARHGVASIVVERNPGTTRHPKMDLTNGRSMELYRRLGLSDAIRAAGVAADHPFNIMWATEPSGHLLHSFRYPSPVEKQAQTTRANDGTGTAEPGVRISQIVLEPVLRAAIEQSPLIDLRFGWKFAGCSQDSEGVTSRIETADGETVHLRSTFLVGCDGGGSRVRRELGISLEGRANVARLMMIHFRSTAREVINPWGIAWHLETLKGSVVAQNDMDTWTLHASLIDGTDESTLDPAQMIRDFFGLDFDFDVLVANPWSPNLLIADSYRQGRVFLAGDSAHQVIPTGGYGMNTGVGDAIDLGWKLGAVINRWAGESLLASYEAERRPIAVQNRHGSEGHFGTRMKVAAAFERALAEGPLNADDAVGEDRRARLGAEIAALGNAENESWGIEHGYRYEHSPIVSGQGDLPTFDPLHCHGDVIPGGRLPHVVLDDGTPLLDRLGPEFTLILRGDASAGDFKAAAETIGVPLVLLRLPEDGPSRLLRHNLLLVRPDQHIAWCGDEASAARGVLERAIGNATSSETSFTPSMDTAL